MIENRLRKVDLLLLPGVHLLDLAGPAQVFSQPRLGCRVRYLAPEGQLQAAQGVGIGPLEAPSPPTETPAGLLVIGANGMPGRLDEPAGRAAVDWVRDCAHHYRAIGAICSGALVLGAAGWLDGREATTHHALLAALAAVAPAARVRDDCLYTVDGPVSTSAGISTAIDMSLHWVARHWGHAAASEIARDLVHFPRSRHRGETLGFELQYRHHIDQRVHAAQDRMVRDPALPGGLAALAEAQCLSERQFRRRFRSATGISALEYLRAARLELAASLLLDTKLPLSRIAARCGFSDDRSLRRLWVRTHGQSPADWRRAPNRERHKS